MVFLAKNQEKANKQANARLRSQLRYHKKKDGHKVFSLFFSIFVSLCIKFRKAEVNIGVIYVFKYPFLEYHVGYVCPYL